MRSVVAALVPDGVEVRTQDEVGSVRSASDGIAVDGHAAGVAQLRAGGRAAFLGRVAEDQLGAVYAHDIEAVGVPRS